MAEFNLDTTQFRELTYEGEIMEFNFKKLNLTEEEFKTTVLPTSNSIGIGRKKLRILKAEFKKMSEGDCTWAVHSLILSETGIKSNVIAGKTKAFDKEGKPAPMMFYWVIIPTQRIEYEKPGISPKGALFLFQKYREFMIGLGENMEYTVESLEKCTKKWFKNPEALEGEVLDVLIGYNKCHIMCTEGVFTVVDAKGNRIMEQEYTSRDDAKDAAKEAGLPALQDWAEITKFYKKG